MYRLKRNFFTRPTLEVCRDILGKYLVHKIGDKKLVGKIVEVEAYIGPNDRASHALGGKMTERNRAEFLEGGHVYIYLVYGMYWQFNISTGKKGSPECFLIRALQPELEIRNPKSEIRNKSQILNSKFQNLANGPGKLCRWMKLSKKHYGLDLTKSRELWVEDRGSVPSLFGFVNHAGFTKPNNGNLGGSRNRTMCWNKLPKPQIVRAKRIGIDYAGKYWAGRLWRFYIKGDPFVSRF